MSQECSCVMPSLTALPQWPWAEAPTPAVCDSAPWLQPTVSRTLLRAELQSVMLPTVPSTLLLVVEWPQVMSLRVLLGCSVSSQAQRLFLPTSAMASQAVKIESHGISFLCR